jgi:hypothetical protein
LEALQRVPGVVLWLVQFWVRLRRGWDGRLHVPQDDDINAAPQNKVPWTTCAKAQQAVTFAGRALCIFREVALKCLHRQRRL